MRRGGGMLAITTLKKMYLLQNNLNFIKSDTLFILVLENINVFKGDINTLVKNSLYVPWRDVQITIVYFADRLGYRGRPDRLHLWILLKGIIFQTKFTILTGSGIEILNHGGATNKEPYSTL